MRPKERKICCTIKIVMNVGGRTAFARKNAINIGADDPVCPKEYFSSTNCATNFLYIKNLSPKNKISYFVGM